MGVFSAILSVLLLAPYFLGQLLVGGGEVFLGSPLVGPADYYSYLAWITQAREGEILFYNYSASPQLSSTGALFHPIFLVLGVIAKYTALSPMTLYHGATGVFGFLWVFVCYRFFCRAQ